MKTIFRSFLVLALSLLAALPARAEAPTTRAAALSAQLDQMMSAAYPAGEPGAAVIVTRGGETLATHP